MWIPFLLILEIFSSDITSHYLLWECPSFPITIIKPSFYRFIIEPWVWTLYTVPAFTLLWAICPSFCSWQLSRQSSEPWIPYSPYFWSCLSFFFIFKDPEAFRFLNPKTKWNFCTTAWILAHVWICVLSPTITSEQFLHSSSHTFLPPTNNLR